MLREKIMTRAELLHTYPTLDLPEGDHFLAVYTEQDSPDGENRETLVQFYAAPPARGLTRSVIGLTGFSGAGKDEAAKGLYPLGYRRVSFADPLRKILYALNPIVVRSYFSTTRLRPLVDRIGWDEAKKYVEVRELLQRIGTEGGRKILGESIWVDTALKDYKQGEKLVVTDVRFDSEAKAIRALGGTIVRVARPGVWSVNSHISDKGIDPTLIDYTILNDGTPEDLQNKLADLRHGVV